MKTKVKKCSRSSSSGKSRKLATHKKILRPQPGSKPQVKSSVRRPLSNSKLKDVDPEFYEFLQKEDKSLLETVDLENSDVDDETESESENQTGAAKHDDEEAEVNKILDELEGVGSSDDEPSIHKPPAELEEFEAASDSDADPVEDDPKSAEAELATEVGKPSPQVSLAKVKRWKKLIQEKPTVSLLHDIVQGLKVMVASLTNQVEDSIKSVEDSSVFNALMHLCLDSLFPTILKLLHISGKHAKLDRPSLITQSKGWKRIRLDVKMYLSVLLRVLSELSQPNTLDVILKHVLNFTTFFACFGVLARNLLKRLVKLWSEGGETTRVVAFLCINRLLSTNTDMLLDTAIKKMYIAYVQNCKFTSPTTLPVINFMQRTLVEVFGIRVLVTYQHAFVYIRQLAIHLRNAIINHKAEQIAAVYNWQYIHSIQLWVRVLCALCPDDCLDPLIYPLVQTIIGVIKLVPTQKFYPLRFHCVRSLTSLCASLNVFIPILPFLIEVFEQTDFNRRHRSISSHPINFTTILKLSKSQIVEKSFKDGVIDQLYELLLEYFVICSCEIGFPELVLPVIVQVKDFLKKCKVANYCKQMKQLLEKLQESCDVVVERRRKVTFSISDTAAIEAWQNELKAEGTPISKYYAIWKELRNREKQHEISGKDRMMMDIEVPTIDRSKFKRKASAEERKEFAALFEQSDSDEEDTERFLLKDERSKKGKLTVAADGDQKSDYSDFDSDELEALAQSEDDSSEEAEQSGEDSNDRHDDDKLATDITDREDEADEAAADRVEDLQLSSDEEEV